MLMLSGKADLPCRADAVISVLCIAERTGAQSV